LGDSKETVRQQCRGILNTLSMIHPASKIFPMLMDSMKSAKNARLRAECLEQMALLIEHYALSVCGTLTVRRS